MRLRLSARFAAVFLAGLAIAAEPPGPKPLPPLREQAEIQQQWLQLRLERNLPKLMRKYGIQMWIVDCREYAEDPVLYSLVAPTMFAARRRTIYVFYDRGPEKGVERLALGGGSNGGLYTVYRDSSGEGREIYLDAQWRALRKLVDERQPATIGVNISLTHAFSDGLSAGEWEQLQQALGPENLKKVVRSEGLPLDYIALRIPEMLPTYRQMMEIIHWLSRRAFSNEVITPGKTTTTDVVWWLRQKFNELGYNAAFQPAVTVQGPSRKIPDNMADDDLVVINRGDVLHVDFGISAMRLATDTQHMGYVLQPGETEVPASLRRAMAEGNRMQDILMEEMRPGRSGNEVLASTLERVKQAGLSGTIYTHPIGDHGHGAGPLIGLWDRQQGVPGRGEVLLLPSTWYSVELESHTPIPEWGGKEITIGLEEDAVLDEAGKMNWVLRRQTEYYVVK